MGIRGELYTQQVQVDKRSYFFNVKENHNGDVFLQIVESKIKDGEDERRAIVVFADDMQKFLSGMESSLNFIEKERKERAKAKAEKKAAKEAKYASSSKEGESKKVVFRRKGQSRLVAEKKNTGTRLHVTSKRKTSSENPSKE